MENSAISFSIAIDADGYKQERLFSLLDAKYHMKYNDRLSLLTIRHYDEPTITRLIAGREILVEQRTRHTVRFALK